MPLPSSPSVAFSPVGGPAFAAPHVDPVQDATGRQLQQAGAAALKMGQGLMDVQTELDVRVRTARVREADTAYSEAVRNLLTGPNGYTSTVGKAAVDAYATLKEKLASERVKIAESLDDETQRDEFNRTSEAHWDRALSIADSHYTRSALAYEESRSVARAETATDNYIDAYDHIGPGPEVDEALATLRSEVNTLSTLRGYSPEQRDQTERAALSSAYGQVISKLADRGDTSRAQKLFERVRDMMPQDQRAKAETILQRANVNQTAHSLSVKMQQDQMTVTAAMDSLDSRVADGSLTVEERDAALERFTAADALRRGDEARYRADVLQRAQAMASTNRKWLVQGGSITPSMWDELTASGADTEFKLWIAQGGQWITSDTGTQAMLTMTEARLKAYGSPEELVKAWRADLNDQDLARLVKMWGEVRKPVELRDAITMPRGEQILNLLVAHGDLPQDATLKDPATAQRVQEWDAEIVSDVNSTVQGRSAVMSDIATSFEKLRNLTIVNGKALGRPLATLRNRAPDELASLRIELPGGRSVDLKGMGTPGLPNYEQLVDIVQQRNKELALKGESELQVSLTTLAEAYYDEWTKYNEAQAAKRRAAEQASVEQAEAQVVNRYHRQVAVLNKAETEFDSLAAAYARTGKRGWKAASAVLQNLADEITASGLSPRQVQAHLYAHAGATGPIVGPDPESEGVHTVQPALFAPVKPPAIGGYGLTEDEKRGLMRSNIKKQ